MGFALLGPLGALLGVVVGSQFDKSAEKERVFDSAEAQTRARARSFYPGDFAVSLVVLFAAVAAADKRISTKESEFIRNYFTGRFGAANTADLMKVFDGALRQTIDYRAVAAQARDNMDYYSRLQLLQMLYGLAKVDGIIDAAESEILNQIAFDLGIDSRDQVSVRSVYFQENHRDYKTLGISPDASPEEIKKAYRSMVAKYHPDKVAHLGQDFIDIAEEKFIAVKEAYDRIRQERGF